MSDRRPAFASDAATARYYDRRAAEYDEWYRGEGHFAERDRPGWAQEVDSLTSLLGSLASLTTLDVACGTGYLSRHLHGPVIAVDQSAKMVAIARMRIRCAAVGDALALPFVDGGVERVFTGHFYGHLADDERGAFVKEARRVGGELVVVDSARRPELPAETWQPRILNDGSSHRIWKRFLGPEELADEIGGERIFAGTWFVGARVRWR